MVARWVLGAKAAAEAAAVERTASFMVRMVLYCIGLGWVSLEFDFVRTMRMDGGRCVLDAWS